MVRIAICDDEEEYREKILQQINIILKEENVVWNYCIFDNSEMLLSEIENEKQKFDLFLLDIEMPNVNGIELAERLRVCYPDTFIIFITAYEKYVYDSFKVQAYRFILKDRMEELLPEALNNVIKEIQAQEKKCYIVQNPNYIEKILQKNIIYVRYNNKYVYIEKIYGEATKTRTTLKNIYKDLDSDLFVWIDKGCICNINYIKGIKDNKVLLINNTELDISRSKLRDLKKSLITYLKKI